MTALPPGAAESDVVPRAMATAATDIVKTARMIISPAGDPLLRSDSLYSTMILLLSRFPFTFRQIVKSLTPRRPFIPCSAALTALALALHEQESDSPGSRGRAGDCAARGARGALSRL